MQDDCVLSVIAPLAPHQSWFPQLLELIVEMPLKLPYVPDLLSQNRGQSVHPNPQYLNLAAWKISGIKILQNDFQGRLPLLLTSLEEHQLKDYTQSENKF